MRVLVACEFSGIVRDAFAARGHDAWSCDLIDCERGGKHHRGDVLEFLAMAAPFHLMIAHPPCTFLASSGARWFIVPGRAAKRAKAVQFVRDLLGADVPRIALENPVGVLSTIVRKPDQYIQPWQFGHGETKRTGLWLKNLPRLMPSEIVEGRSPRVHHEAPSHDRWKNRSRTLTGIADAMACQWGGAS